MFVFDPTINLGSVVMAAGFVIGGVTVVVAMRSDLKGMTTRLLNVETEMKKITEILVVAARQEERLNAQDQRLNAQAREISDLRRGRGFITEEP